MYRFKRLMVGLDFTLMDKMLISYVSFLSGIIKPDKIYFINILPNLDIPDSIRKNFPELNKPMDEKLKQEMQEEVEKNFKDHELYDIEYQVREGSPFEKMLEWSHIKNIDLLILGRKEELKGSAIVSSRLARKVMCSVLFVPEKINQRLKEIFVPCDFSENSKMALEEAISLANNDVDSTVYIHHVYHLPSGYYVTGKSEEEFSQIMKEHATKRYNELIEPLKFDHTHLQPIFDLDEHLSPANLINATAHKKKADIVIVGAKGKTKTAAVLLGSVTEKLMKLDSNIPLLVVKQKDKSFNFADLLKNV